MILSLDIGNSHILGGVFKGNQLLLQFRHPSDSNTTSDQLGLFFRSVLRENGIDPKEITHIGYSSVLPSLDYSVRSAFIKYFNQEPFVLKPGIKTGIKIKCKNPHEVGSDRIANTIAAVENFPNKNIIIIDFGTATTLDAVNQKGEYLGGAILPGLKISMQALSNSTAKLAPVLIVKPNSAIGQTTISNIQSGLYHGHIGAVKNLLTHFIKEAFNPDDQPLIIGTGGFAHLFSDEQVFTCIIPELSIQGVMITLLKNMPL